MTENVRVGYGEGDEVFVEGDSLMQPLPGLVQRVDAYPDA